MFKRKLRPFFSCSLSPNNININNNTLKCANAVMEAATAKAAESVPSDKETFYNIH